MSWKAHLQRAIALFGSQEALARAMGCSQSKISWLIHQADKISGDDAVMIEQLTRGRVTRAQLRPDLWAPLDDRETAHSLRVALCETEHLLSTEANRRELYEGIAELNAGKGIEGPLKR